MGALMDLNVIRAKCVACDTAKNIPALHTHTHTQVQGKASVCCVLKHKHPCT